jgi:hypothetical protein
MGHDSSIQPLLLSLWLPIFSYLRSRANARADDEREKEKRRFKVSERAWLLASVPWCAVPSRLLRFSRFRHLWWCSPSRKVDFSFNSSNPENQTRKDACCYIQ